MGSLAGANAEQARAVLLCSPNTRLARLVASSVEPSSVRIDLATGATEAFLLLDSGVPYSLVILDGRFGDTALDRILRHPRVDPRSVIEFESEGSAGQPAGTAAAMAERQAQWLVPAIIESLRPDVTAAIVH